MKEFTLLIAVFTGISSFISIPSHAALVDNGGGLIYDTVLDITWSQPDAMRTWHEAMAWASGLTLGGVSGWRLPYISVAAGVGPLPEEHPALPIDCSTATEFACRDNEMGYMFFHNLSGSYGQSILESEDPDLDLFPTLREKAYWSRTEVDTWRVWGFNFGYGSQGVGEKYPDNGFNITTSWAVHSGDIHPIPIPAAIWLFGSGLMGLVGIARRRTTKDDKKITTPKNNDPNSIHRDKWMHGLQTKS
jgi:hypothetical protein